MWVVTLIDVRAVSARFIQCKALVADATEHAINVFTFAKHAEVTEHLAFVDINARLFVAFIRMHETHLALTTERTWIIETLTILAQVGIIGALVNVLANVAVSAESRVTDALERSFRVDTLGILIATAIVGQTFVDVTANDAIAGESFATAALVTTLCVVALGINVTAECSKQTLVIVRATRAVVLDGVAFLAAALV